MKKKIMLAAVLCLTLTAGCAKTPEDAIVKKKGEQNLENYKETEEIPMKENQEADTGNSKVSALISRLQVPEKYTAAVQSEDGRFHLTCDAEVEVPDVDKVGVYKVSQLPFDEKLINQVTGAVFGEHPVYDGNKYFQITKEDALAKLEELKKYQAEGNTDPYGYIAAMEESGEEYQPDEVYNIQNDIDNWEEIYQNAPEEKIKEVVEPMVAESGPFIGAVEMEEGVYYYKLKKGSGDHMDIQVCRLEEGSRAGEEMWNESLYDGESSGEADLPSREEAEQRTGITPEEAIQKADEYLHKIGLTDFSAKEVKLALKVSMTEDGNNLFSYQDSCAGYQVEYTRNLEGFPVTSEMNYGGGLESMESTQETWGYERVEILVNQEGLQQMKLLNLYQIGEKQVENVEMKTFPEIAAIFEQMIQIQNADMNEGETLNLQIDRVTLGYMRVYDPGADFTSGILVPVWDFFGKSENEMIVDGEKMEYSDDQTNHSYLTINAVDGTVINRSLGY